MLTAKVLKLSSYFCIFLELNGFRFAHIRCQTYDYHWEDGFCIIQTDSDTIKVHEIEDC